MKSIISVLLLSVFSTVMYSQDITGRVIDKVTGKGIFGVQIYYKNTSLSVTSQHDGYFEIRVLPGEYNELVFGRIGYENRTLRAKPYNSIDVEMTPSTRPTVGKEKRDRKWERLFKRFRQAIIGETENAESVEIANPKVVALNKSGDGTIIGYAIEPLEMINHAIGYKLYFFFKDQFEIDGQNAEYNGIPYFVKMKSEDSTEIEKWEKNREKTYQGSRQHFLYALSQGKLIDEGYEIYQARLDQNTGNFKKTGDIDLEDIYQKGVLSFDAFLMVKYTKEKPNNSFLRAYSSTTFIGSRDGRRNNRSLTIENTPDKDGQVSYLFSQKKALKIDSLGIVQDPQYLLEYGYWSWERLAELMPLDYHLEIIGAIPRLSRPDKQ